MTTDLLIFYLTLAILALAGSIILYPTLKERSKKSSGNK